MAAPVDDSKNLPFREAVLRDRDGDLKKEWYVEYYPYSELAGDVIRKRVKIGTEFTTDKARRDQGKKIVREINSLLHKGYHIRKSKPAQHDEPERPVSIYTVLDQTLKVIAPTLREKSVTTYRSPVEKFKLFDSEEKYTLENFINRDCYLFRDFMLNQLKNSSRTANNSVMHLKTLFSHFVKRNPTAKNPFEIDRLKQQATTRNVAFTDEDRLKLESYLKKYDPELYFLTRFIYLAFIRPGELNKLKVSALSLQNNYITIAGDISKSGKTETAQIIGPLRNEIGAKLSTVPRDHYLFGKGLVPAQILSGKQVAFRRHETALKSVGLHERNYTLYSWKHTGAVNAYRAGVGLKELQGLLRHSSIQITDIYLKSLGLRTDPNLQNYSW